MKNLVIYISCFIFSSVTGQDPSVGIFRYSGDVGKPKNGGSSIYNETDQSYTIKGAGYNIWFKRDEFHYLYNKIKGDFILTANFKFSGSGTESHRKTGWMLRTSTEEDSRHISA